MESCVFCKIVDKNISAQIVYEDEWVIAFRDINPKAPVHILIIPKEHIDSMLELSGEKHSKLISHLFLSVPRIACFLGLQEGFKTLINTGYQGGQEVFHLHLHLLGGSGISEL